MCLSVCQVSSPHLSIKMTLLSLISAIFVFGVLPLVLFLSPLKWRNVWVHSVQCENDNICQKKLLKYSEYPHVERHPRVWSSLNLCLLEFEILEIENEQGESGVLESRFTERRSSGCSVSAAAGRIQPQRPGTSRWVSCRRSSEMSL